MKTIYNINKWFYIITLILYVTIYLGVISQFFLGIFQVLIIFPILLFYRKLFNKQIVIKSIIYLLGIGIFTVLYLFLQSNSNDFINALTMSIVPMSLGLFHVHITYKLKQISEEQNSLKIHEIGMRPE